MGADLEGWEGETGAALGAWCPGKLIWGAGGRKTPAGGGVCVGVCAPRGFIELVEKSFGNLCRGPLVSSRSCCSSLHRLKPAQREWGKRPPHKVAFPGNCPSFVPAPNTNPYLALVKSMHATEGHTSPFQDGLDLAHLENSQRKSSCPRPEGGRKLGGLG